VYQIHRILFSGEDYVGEKLAASMPTSEEYEAMAAAAAEKANE